MTCLPECPAEINSASIWQINDHTLLLIGCVCFLQLSLIWPGQNSCNYCVLKCNDHHPIVRVIDMPVEKQSSLYNVVIVRSSWSALCVRVCKMRPDGPRSTPKEKMCSEARCQEQRNAAQTHSRTYSPEPAQLSSTVTDFYSVISHEVDKKSLCLHSASWKTLKLHMVEDHRGSESKHLHKHEVISQPHSVQSDCSAFPTYI